MGPSLSFKQEDWTISSDLVDGRCVRIHYSKRGDWTEEQIRMVLAYNSQGGMWTENPKAGVAKLIRKWKRADGATFSRGS